MAIWEQLSCPTCGSNGVELVNGFLCCKYCKSKHTYNEKISEDEVISLNAATTARQLMRLDDAQEQYDLLLKKYPDNTEANWGAFLCSYGIIYEEDYDGTFKPTCHRLNERPVKKSPYYGKLTEESKARADEIEKLRLKIMDEVKKIQPYDVFICYKQNEEGKTNSPTREAKWARDVYESLKDLGLKVFYAEKSLSGTNVDYEPHIYAALRSAKLMIVLATSIEHVNATWVANEWKRYVKYVREGEDKTIRVVYDGIEAYDLPKELQNKQAICHDDMHWSEALADSVRELFNKAPELVRKEYGKVKYAKKQVSHGNVEKRDLPVFEKTSVPASEATNLNMIEEWMRLKKFKPAIANLRSVISVNNACSRGYWNLFLCENGCSNADEFFNSNKEIKDFKNLENALASADDKQRSTYLSVLEKRVKRSATLALFEEFISLPGTTETQIEDVARVMYRKSLGSRDRALFDSALKVIKDTETYIEWNVEFARGLLAYGQKADAEKYLDAVLNLDEGHQEALLCKYMIKLGVKNENEFVHYCLYKLSDYSELEKIYEYGYFTHLSKMLFDACLDWNWALKEADFSKTLPRRTKLVDFLLSIIPQNANGQYLEFARSWVEKLLLAGAYGYVNKYLGQILTLSPNDDEAYLQRVLVKYKINKPYWLIKHADDLMEEEDYLNALNAYAAKYPNAQNPYMQLYSQFDYILELCKKERVTIAEFASLGFDSYSLKNLAKTAQAKFAEAARTRGADKKKQSAITVPMIISFVVFAAVMFVNFDFFHMIDVIVELVRMVAGICVAASVILIILGFTNGLGKEKTVDNSVIANAIERRTALTLVTSLAAFVFSILLLNGVYMPLENLWILMVTGLWGYSIVYLLLDWDNAAIKTSGSILDWFGRACEWMYDKWYMWVLFMFPLVFGLYGLVIFPGISLIIFIAGAPIYYFAMQKHRNSHKKSA